MRLGSLSFPGHRIWSWIAAALFGTAGVGKLLADSSVGTSALLAQHAPMWVQRVAQGIETAVPGLEVGIAVAFLFSFGAKAASLVGVALACVFLAVAVVVPKGFECECFGILGGFSSRAAHVATAAAVLLVSVLAGLSARRPAREAFPVAAPA